MKAKSAASSGVETLKWLVVRATPARDDGNLRDEDGGPGTPDDPAHSRPVVQIREDPREREHVDRRRDGELRRLQPDGAPVMMRGSSRRPSEHRGDAPSISRAEAVRTRSVLPQTAEHQVESCRQRLGRLVDVVTVNITMIAMLTVSTSARYSLEMPAFQPRAPPQTRDRYHHGDLRRALLDEALRTIHQDEGRGADAARAGEAGRVAHALYRHFADKRRCSPPSPPRVFACSANG